jgi:predicted RNA methylase
MLASSAREGQRWTGGRLGRALRRLSRPIYRTLSARLIDRRYGFETWRPVPLTELGIAHEDRVGYEPSDSLVLRRAFRHLEVGPQEVFLDLGSGKGRAILEAARQPFKRIIGVEISPQLNQIAASNLEATRSRLRCQNIELVQSDIVDFRFPDDVTVVYAFNPFGGAVFEAAMRALIASFDRRPRRMYLIYLNPKEHDRLVASGRFRLLTRLWRWGRRPAPMRGHAMHIYEVRPATADAPRTVPTRPNAV